MNMILQPEQGLPVNPDMENYLIGTVLAYPKNWQRVSYVHPEDFSQPEMAAVWDKIRNFIDTGRSISPAFIAMALYENEKDQKALSDFLLTWQTNIFSPNADDFASCVKDLSDRRKLISVAEKIVSDARDTSCGLNAAEIANLGIRDISTAQSENNDFMPAHKVGETVIESLDKAEIVTRTGFDRFDEAIGGGFYRNRFYGIGARMKSGKSLFMSTIAYNMAFSGSRVLYLCLEMGAAETYQRLLSMHMGVNSLQFLKPNVKTQDWFKKRVTEANEAFKETKLYFRSKPRMAIDDLKATIARAGMSGKVDGVIVDYLQLVEGKSAKQSQAEHYDNVAQTLAEAAKRYDIWVLSAAQLNQEGNIRGGEGLLNACDITFALNKIEGDLSAHIPARAWLEMKVSRYTPYANIGSEALPAYEIDIEAGPKFVEMRK